MGEIPVIRMLWMPPEQRLCSSTTPALLQECQNTSSLRFPPVYRLFPFSEVEMRHLYYSILYYKVNILVLYLFAILGIKIDSG